MTDLNEIQAGEYELVALRWDQITSDPGKPLDFVRHRCGDIVNLDAADAKRLWVAGAIRKNGEDGDRTFEDGPSRPPGEVGTETVERATDPLTDPAAASVKDVLAALEQAGNDPAAAQSVLELEKGGQNRATLVKALEATIAGESS